MIEPAACVIHGLDKLALNAGDEYTELYHDAEKAAVQWKALREREKHGFEVVMEATGVERLANEAINFVRRGGTLMVYGVYENKALVHWLACVV